MSSQSSTPSPTPSPARGGGRVCACACAKAGAGDCACACAKEKEKEKHLPNGVLALAADAPEHSLPSVYFEYSTQRVLINRVRGTCRVLLRASRLTPRAYETRVMSMSLSPRLTVTCRLKPTCRRVLAKRILVLVLVLAQVLLLMYKY